MLGLAVTSCAAEFDPTPDWQREGETVTVFGYGNEEADVCPGTFEALDRVAVGIADYHGFDPAQLQIEYHWVNADRFYAEPWCPNGASGCAGDKRVKAPTIIHFHELSHAVDQAYLPYRSSPLAEGFATIHRGPTAAGFELGEHAGHDAPEHWGDIVQIFVDQPAYAAQFGRVGHFTTFLVDRYGIGAVNDLSARVGEDASLVDWRRELNQTLGDPFGDVMDHYANYQPCTTDQFRSKIWECAGEVDFTLSPDSESFEVPVDLGCSDPRAIGVDGGSLKTYRRFTVEGVATAAYYRFELADGTGELAHGRLLIERCDVGCSPNTLEATAWGQPLPQFEGQETTVHVLTPGSYTVVFRGRGAHTLSVSVE